MVNMKSEIQTNPSARYLLCSHSVSDKMLDKVKDQVKTFMVSKQKDELYSKFINWQKKNNEIAVLTLYAFADIPLPKQFDIVFQIDNPQNYTEINYSVTQGIFNGYISINELSQGHKHILILEFKDAVPDIFKILSDFDETKPYTNHKELGFCTKADFEFIRRKPKSDSLIQ